VFSTLHLLATIRDAHWPSIMKNGRNHALCTLPRLACPPEDSGLPAQDALHYSPFTTAGSSRFGCAEVTSTCRFGCNSLAAGICRPP